MRGPKNPKAHTIPRGYVGLFLTSGVMFCVVAKRAAERREKACLGGAKGG